MRYVFIGASTLAVATAHLLADRGHEVIVIERDKAVIDGLAEHLDCGFLHADGSKPAVLAEVTVGDDHSMNLDAMIKLLVSFGYLYTKPTKQDQDHI